MSGVATVTRRVPEEVVVTDGGSSSSDKTASSTSSADSEEILWLKGKVTEVRWRGPRVQEKHGMQSRSITQVVPVVCRSFHCQSCIAKWLYRVEGQRKEETVHHDRLRRCEDRAIPFWVRRRRHRDEREESVDGDATIIEGVNSDLDETVAFGEDVPEVAGETSMVDEEVLTVDSTKDEPEWNLGALFESTEPDESQRGRVRRRPAYLSDYCT